MKNSCIIDHLLKYFESTCVYFYLARTSSHCVTYDVLCYFKPSFPNLNQVVIILTMSMKALYP